MRREAKLHPKEIQLRKSFHNPIFFIPDYIKPGTQFIPVPSSWKLQIKEVVRSIYSTLISKLRLARLLSSINPQKFLSQPRGAITTPISELSRSFGGNNAYLT
jgi:hypothetical protein